MAKKMLIDATHAEETRVVVADGNKVEEFDFESLNKRQLAGNIYLAKVTRVEPSLQAAFVDYGGNRHGFLAFSEIHPDYYQIPTADREALIAEEQEYARSQDEVEEGPPETKPKRRRRRRKPSGSDTTVAAKTETDAVTTGEVGEDTTSPSGMDVVDLETDAADSTLIVDGAAPETVSDTPVLSEEAPSEDAPQAEVDAPEAAETAAATASEAAPEVSDAPDADVASTDTAPEEAAPAVETAEGAETDETAAEAAAPVEDAKPAPKRRRASRKKAKAAPEEGAPAEDAETAPEDGESADPDISTVADDDDQEDIRPVRKPRPRRYKIQEVIKVRQIMLVQVVKEERGNKGAALTTYLSLAGRYCVLMPNTARGGGISRKITNAADRKKLKEIATSLDVPQGAGLIVRTAGANRTKSEIKRDYEYLQRQWEQVRDLTLKSVAPAPIYEEGDLIHRTIRDLYNRDIDEVLVEGEAGYRHAKNFMKMIMPSHAKKVKHYNEPMPLYARFQVEGYLADMFNPVVQLRSGGYIVIGITEALVAIDVNSGRATKEGSLEETATKTNLEAAEEVARQLRLRDLAGLIVIDFIDMDERKNNAAVEKRIKDKLKTDRARIQVGRISGFGLLEMSRQRLRPGMLEATTQPCHACHGTGLVRSDDSLALSILRQLEEEGTRGRSREVLVTAPVGIVNFIMNSKREYLAAIEGRYGMAVRIEADPMLVSPDFKIEKFKTATRKVVAAAPVISMDSALMDEIEAEADAEIEETQAEVTAPEAETPEEGAPKKRRRRRRGGRGRRKNSDVANGETDAETPSEASADTDTATDETPAEAAPVEGAEGVVTEEAEEKPAEKPKRKRSRKKAPVAEAEVPVADESVTEEIPEAAPTEATPVEVAAEDTPVEEAAVEAAVEEASAEPVPEPEVAAAEPEGAEPDVASEQDEPAPEPVMAEAAPEPEPVPVVAEEPAAPPKPKRSGWWNLG